VMTEQARQTDGAPALSTQADSDHVSPDFDDNAFNACLDSLGQEIPFEIMDELGGGRSGAKILSLNVRPGNDYGLQGHYILNLCPSRYARQEKESHQIIERDPIMSQYVPHLALDLPCQDGQFGGIFYRVVGKSLLTMTTLQDCLDGRLYPANVVQAIATAMLQWSVPRQSGPGGSGSLDVLDVIRRGLGQHRLDTLYERLTGVVDHLERARIEGEPLGNRWLVNPLPYLLDRQARLEKERVYPILQGNLHGDLHLANVIIPRARGPGPQRARGQGRGLFCHH
jgi:hypothetical protein